VDHDVPTIATGGDGDVAVSPDGKDILVAIHDDSTVADNTNVDIYAWTVRCSVRSPPLRCRQHASLFTRRQMAGLSLDGTRRVRGG